MQLITDTNIIHYSKTITIFPHWQGVRMPKISVEALVRNGLVYSLHFNQLSLDICTHFTKFVTLLLLELISAFSQK